MSDAGYSMLGAGAWGRPTEMLWGGRWERGSCLGTHVRIKDFKLHINLDLYKKVKTMFKKPKSVRSVSQLVQSHSPVRLFATPWIIARQASLSITNSRSSPKLMSIKSVMPSSHLILWRPLLLLPPIPPSIRVFSNESTLPIRWPKYWSFGFIYKGIVYV